MLPFCSKHFKIDETNSAPIDLVCNIELLQLIKNLNNP